MNINPEQKEKLLKLKEAIEKAERTNNRMEIPEVPKEVIEKSAKHVFPEPPRQIIESAKNKKYSFEFHANFRSFKCNNEKFANYLKGDNGHYHDAVNSIINSVEGGGCNIPFDVDEEHLDMTPRIITIFQAGEIYDNRKILINKSTYIAPFFLGDPIVKKREAIRIYFYKEDQNIKILLIDLYHLLATTKAAQISKTFGQVCNYSKCINSLRRSNCQ